MTMVFRIVIFGPSESGKSLLLRRIHEFYRDASLHDIRFLGGGPSTGVDFCSFMIGNFKYEVYAPPAASSLRLFRNKLVKNSDGIIFIIPAREDLLERTASFILELKRLLFDKYRNKLKEFPIIYAINLFDKKNLDPNELIEQLNLPEDTIIYTFSMDSEKDIRELFGKITLLASLRRLDPKSYYVELDKLKAETKTKLRRMKKPTVEEVTIPATEIPPIEIPPPLQEPISEEIEALPSPTEVTLGVQPSEERPHTLNIMRIPDSLKNKLLQNYINEVVLVEFDRSIGHIPAGYAFGTGKVVSYISDPSCLVELSIIAKHSMGFLLKDGFTFLGLVNLASQGFIILETTSSHMKKMVNLVKGLKKVLSKYRQVTEQILITTLNNIL